MSFRIMIVTSPEIFPGEEKQISRLLESGLVDRIHIRKPECSESEVEALISNIPEETRHRLSLHDHHRLAVKYDCGVHLNSRHKAIPADFRGVCSKSCHSLAEIRELRNYDYAFLSPVFPSISKSEYNPAISIDEMRGEVSRKVVALGGVKPDKFPLLREIGFGGGAMLGYVWNALRKCRCEELLSELKKFVVKTN